MLLLVGLGNIGDEYVGTRHNTGFSVIDRFASKNGYEINKTGFKGNYLKIVYHNVEILMLKPSTFMNLSGLSVREIVNFYKINIEDIIVIYDDMDLPCGKIRLKEKGTSGGHRGIQNIIDNLGTTEIKRIKVGIGHPEHGVIDYVLGKPKGEEKEKVDQGIDKAVEAIEKIIDKGFYYSMSQSN